MPERGRLLKNLYICRIDVSPDCISNTCRWPVFQDCQKGFMKLKGIGISLMWGVMRLFAKLPLKFHYFWAGIAVWILKNIAGYRREVVMVNLTRAFPEKDYSELKAISDRFYTHLGEILAEAIWFGGSDYGRLRKAGICRITNFEVLSDAYNESPGVTVMFSHCGNWEIVGGIWSYNYAPEKPYPCDENSVYVVYKKQRSAFWNEILKRNRMAPVPDYHGEVESADILRFALRNRGKKGIYVYPTDQYPYSGTHDIGLFLNQRTKAMFGGAGVAHKLGMSVLYMKMVNTGRGHYEMTFVPICSDASTMSPEEIVRRYFDLLEEEIKETPYNWLWSHKRWK